MNLKYQSKSIVVNVPQNSRIFCAGNTGSYYVSFDDAVCGNVTVPLYGGIFIERLLELNANFNFDEKLIHCVLEEMIKASTSKISCKTVVSRMVEENGNFYYFAGNEKVVVVEPGEVKLVKNESLESEFFKFASFEHTLEQVRPKMGGNFDLTKKIGELFRLSPFYAVLATIVIVAMFIPNVVKPILHIKCKTNKQKAGFAKLMQAIVDPVDIIDYAYSILEDESYAVKYLHCAVNLKELEPIIDVNLDGETPKGWNMGGIRNPLVTFDVDCIDISSKIASMLVTVVPEEAYEETDVATVDCLRTNELPMMLAEIFTVISQAMLLKNEFKKDDNSQLGEFIQWAKAISKVLYGSEELFTKAWSLHSPFGQADISLFEMWYGLNKNYGKKETLKFEFAGLQSEIAA